MFDFLCYLYELEKIALSSSLRKVALQRSGRSLCKLCVLGRFARLVEAKWVPKASGSLAIELESFQVGRPGTCSNALLILLASFVRPKWAQESLQVCQSTWIEPLPTLRRWRRRQIRALTKPSDLREFSQSPESSCISPVFSIQSLLFVAPKVVSHRVNFWVGSVCPEGFGEADWSLAGTSSALGTSLLAAAGLCRVARWL